MINLEGSCNSRKACGMFGKKYAPTTNRGILLEAWWRSKRDCMNVSILALHGKKAQAFCGV
jgi:hypothetical protein